MIPSFSSALPSTLPALTKLLCRKYWNWLIPIAILNSAWALDNTIFPYIYKMIIDAISNHVGDRADIIGTLLPIVLIGAGLWLGIVISFRLAGFAMAYFFPKLEAFLRTSSYDYVLGHSHTYFANNFSGKIANKISDLPRSVATIFQIFVHLLIPSFLSLVIGVAIFYIVAPMAALILFVWVVIHFAICFRFVKRCEHYAHIHSESRSSLMGKIVDSLTNHSAIRLFSRIGNEKKFIYSAQKDELAKHQQAMVVIEKVKIALDVFAFVFSYVCLVGFVVYAWMNNWITNGDTIYILTTSWNVTLIVWITGNELPILYREIGVAKQALSILQTPYEIKDQSAAKSLKISQGEIKFDHVTFHYVPGKNIFAKKNITIQAGQKVGLVGFSGSGKSTFVNLILRLHDLKEGRILIDDQDISQVTQESLREQIAMIPQDATLFHRSLMDNLRYGKNDASPEEVYEAAKLAHCDSFIEQIPEGYQALVGERGVKLSGGQRQRVAIARAILKNAPILILDEATSSLDSVTEKYIQDSLSKLMKDRTTIVIAHRLSTLGAMDRILVFKDGQIIEDGTHEQLITKKSGHYAYLWRMQVDGFLPDRKKGEVIEKDIA